MLSRTRIAAVLAAAMLALAAAAAGAAPPGACSTHASLLQNACFADREDDFLVHSADCAYVVGEDEEKECRADARAEKAEKRDECKEVYAARLELCELLGEERFDVDLSEADLVDEPDGNRYWPLNPGHTHVIVGGGEVTVVTVTDEPVRDVGGIPCRVVRDLVFEEVEEGGSFEYEALEATQDWYGELASDSEIGLSGDTLYCGENTYEIEDGLIDNTDGSFANDNDRVRAGFLVRADPEVFPGLGNGDRQEMASDEAEDYVRYESITATPTEEQGGDAENFPCEDSCLQTFEVNPRDPGEGEFKYYLPDVGFVLATKLELEDGEYVPIEPPEREEVTCVDDGTIGLDVIDEQSCGIGNPVALREAFCDWAEPEVEWLPEDFCD